MRAVVLTPSKRLSKGLDALSAELQRHGYAVDCEPAATRMADVSINWGGRLDKSLEAHVAINPPDAVIRSLSPAETAQYLTWHGIPVAWDHIPREMARPVHRPPEDEFAPVRVHVADLEVLKVEDDAAGAAIRGISRWRYERMIEAACRSVYVLGLHFGCVHLRVHPKGLWHVERVDPHPAVDEALGAAYGAAIARLAAVYGGDPGPLTEATLGADPEFALATEDGKMLYASRYVPYRGEVGYDRQSWERRGTVYPLAEIRPAPTPSPLVLTNNVAKALRKARELLPTARTRWLAGSHPLTRVPTGGHVHVSGVPLTTPLLQALDTYVAIPFMLLEKRTRAKQRRRRYGRLGEFRRKEHGGFEYRTLPSWLVSPAATRAALCLVKTVATEWPRLAASPLRPAGAVKEFYLGKKGRFRLAFHEWWRRVVATPTGDAYAYELAYVRRMVLSEQEWDDDNDIKRAWWNRL